MKRLKLKPLVSCIIPLLIVSCTKSFFRFSGDGRLDYITVGKDTPTSAITDNVSPITNSPVHIEK